jgi:hypothetical protein
MPSDIISIALADVMQDKVADFNRWYNEVHLPEVLACPGYIGATRYECIAGEPQFLAVYDLERADALETPEMRRVYGWGDMAPFMRTTHGRVYRKIFEMAAPR